MSIRLFTVEMSPHNDKVVGLILTQGLSVWSACEGSLWILQLPVVEPTAANTELEAQWQ